MERQCPFEHHIYAHSGNNSCLVDLDVLEIRDARLGWRLPFFKGFPDWCVLFDIVAAFQHLDETLKRAAAIGVRKAASTGCQRGKAFVFDRLDLFRHVPVWLVAERLP